MAIILSKQERAVMQAVYDLSKAKTSVLVGLEDIMNSVKIARKLVLKRPHAEEEFPVAAEADDHIESMGEISPDMPIEEAQVKRKRSLFKRRQEEIAAPIAAPIAPKVYTDEPPVYKGLMEYKKPVKFEEIPHILEILYMEDYFELTEAVAAGEVKYVIKLLNRGQRWLRDERDRKRGVVIKLLTVVATPILSFILGIVLRTWFGS